MSAPAPALRASKYAALFAAEAREQMAEAGRALARLERACDGRESPAAVPNEVDVLFRAVHTVKGMAGAMGYAAAERAAHAAEHALSALRERRAAPPPASLASLVSLIDALDAAVEGEVDGAIDAPTASVVAARAAAAAPADAARPVRVDAGRLDALLDLAGELMTAREQLHTAAARVGDPAVARAAHEIARLAQRLQGEVLDARLVPLDELFERLPRVVREAARAAGREVALDTAGGEVAADRGVVDALAEPLTHLLRNAVDHGIEPGDERLAAGKPRVGRVGVRAARVPGGVAVEVSDDGRGVDRARVLAAARARGAVLPAADGALDDGALLELLAAPGLSTAERVTRVSGRGVGVDAALARVRALGGSLAVVSEAGRGTRFTLRVPLTLAVTPVLVVRTAGATYAVPTAHVRGTRDPDDAPLAPSLAALLGLEARGGTSDEAASAPVGDVVLLDAPGQSSLAVTVDAVASQVSAVVKPIPLLRGAGGVAVGATVLDGNVVAPVLDVPSLLARAARVALRHESASAVLRPPSLAPACP